MPAKEKTSKKNPLSHAAITAIQHGLEKCGVQPTYKSGITWNSMTKGKLSVVMTKGAFGKERLMEVNRSIMSVVQSDSAVCEKHLKSLGVYEEHTSTDTKTGECKAVYISKMSVVPSKDGPPECWLDIQIGDGALDNYNKADAKAPAGSNPTSTGAATEKKSAAEPNGSKKGSKKGGRTEKEPEKMAMFDGWKPGQKTPAQLFAEELAESVIKMASDDKDKLSAYLEPLLTMYANQAYAKGYKAATYKHPADVAELSNRL